MEVNMDLLASLPWYVKWSLGFLGAAGVWKLVQGQVPNLLAALRPLALRATDAFVAVVLAHPVLRWFVLGDKENFLKTANLLLDGLEEISNSVQARLKADLDAASSSPATPTEPPPAA